MTATRMITKRVEKPWGRTGKLWPGFDDAPDDDPVGEIWFQVPDAEGRPRADQPELLIKYLFTSQRLSVQDHPDDATARAKGYPRGKDECWLILDAEPHATIGLGMQRPMTRDELRASAEDGTIDKLMDWRAVKTGDFLYSPAGTVHAIGPGLTLIEIQQNVDLTYRLFDYGSDRELHLDEGIAVADPVPYVAPFIPREVWPGGTLLADGPVFVLERWRKAGDGRLADAGKPLILVPVAGRGTVDGRPLEPGTVWLVEGETPLVLEEDSDVLVAYPGPGAVDGLWSRG